MSYCLNDEFKTELVTAFSNTFRLNLQLERIQTEDPIVRIPRQLEIAQRVARGINENYYHKLPFMWIPYLAVDLAELPNGEPIIGVEVSSVHKAAFGLWN